MQSKSRKTGLIWRWIAGLSAPTRIIGAGGLFLSVSQGVLILQAYFKGRPLAPLPPAETLSLIGGAVTAAGLAGILFQLTDGERQRSLAAANKADQLHAEFGTPEMRSHRQVAYRYFQHLLSLPGKREVQLSLLAENLVAQTAHDIDLPEIESESKEGRSGRVDSVVWSIGEILAFYSRVEYHLTEYFGDDEIDADTFTKIVGPFYWSYWADIGIMEFVKASRRAYHPKVPEWPFYVGPIEALDLRAKRVNAIMADRAVAARAEDFAAPSSGPLATA